MMSAAVCDVQGEQHGFRKAENIRSALEGELFFYGKVLGFNATYSPELQNMTIDNLDGGDGDGKPVATVEQQRATATATAAKEEL